MHWVDLVISFRICLPIPDRGYQRNLVSFFPVPVICSCSKCWLINELLFLGFSILKIVSKYLKTIHARHISHRICNYCKCVGIIVGYFLPRISRRLQPLSFKCEGALIAVLTVRVIFPWKEVCVKKSCSTVWLNFPTKCIWGWIKYKNVGFQSCRCWPPKSINVHRNWFWNERGEK